MLKITEFIELFARLGVAANLSDNDMLNVEKYVCFLYGDPRIESLDELRHKMFGKKSKKREKLSIAFSASLQSKSPSARGKSKLRCPYVPPCK